MRSRITLAATAVLVAGMAALPGGALANVIDRTADAMVTDYVHTGWFPTFNLADAFIVTGAAILVVASWRASGTADTGIRA